MNFLPIRESGSEAAAVRQDSLFLGRLGMNVLRKADMSLRSSTSFSKSGLYRFVLAEKEEEDSLDDLNIVRLSR